MMLLQTPTLDFRFYFSDLAGGRKFGGLMRDPGVAMGRAIGCAFKIFMIFLVRF